MTPELDSKAKIKVVGVGGAGCNVLNTMLTDAKIQGVEFIAINTDIQALSINKAPVKIELGKQITSGLGAGAKPEIGEKAAKESEEEIRNYLEGADMVFISAGMGGGTGTGAGPVVAKIAKELGALTIGVVTKPFAFEGAKRSHNAELGIERMRTEVDALITVPNQKLLEINDPKLSFVDAFKISDSVLSQGVQGISDIIVLPGLINVDFADVSTVMRNSGTALMGIGIGTGENRAEIAAREAISSPLLEVKIDGARGIVYNIVMGPDASMVEVDKASKIINDSASPDAEIIFGASIDPNLNGQIKITVIATGFDTGTYNYNSVSREKIKDYNTTPLDIERAPVRVAYDEPEVVEPTPYIKPAVRYAPEPVEPVRNDYQPNLQHAVSQQPQPRKSLFGGFGGNQTREKANEYSGLDASQFEEDDDYESNSNSKPSVDEDDYMVPPFLRNRR